LYLHGWDLRPPVTAAGPAGKSDRAAFAASCFTAAREKGAGAAETAGFIEELERTGALEEARRRGEKLVGEAKAAFGDMGAGFPENESAGLLAGFAELLR
jgi:hypothetical protein